MDRREWLEPDGLGGFASGTVSTVRTRRYHALLLSAATPPTGRTVLVNGLDAWVETEGGSFPITSQMYLPGVRHPDGESRLMQFESDPWPRFRFRLENGAVVRQEISAWRGKPVTAVSFALESGPARAVLVLRPFLSGRDYHSLHHENPAFRFEPTLAGDRIAWNPYPDVRSITCLTNGTYRHEPTWYRNFLYEAERERGLDFSEDLASPGELRFDLSRGEAVAIWTSDDRALGSDPPARLLERIRREERDRRLRFASPLDRAANDYLVRRGSGSTLVAGYPWFTDWGRDTFIAIRGICLATGSLAEAEGILLEWADAVSEGMLPNRFPDHGESPEFNSVDASLWYVVAVEEFLSRARKLSRAAREKLLGACQAILEGMARGTRYRIQADEDGLLAAGEPGVQLTWMDAKIGEWVVTPRIGKPVEIQALWLNALGFGAGMSSEWKALHEKGIRSFEGRFWSREGYLFDVVDVDHVPGVNDASFRPNQIFAIGGVPRRALLDDEKARSVVSAVESRLWTPAGLRSLAPEDPRYINQYLGGVSERDGSYHQGTVWPWLAGAFLEAWLRAGMGTPEQARDRFLEPLLSTVGAAGIGHIAEIADAEPPHAPRGCPFQAWSVGEALRTIELLESSSGSRLEAAPVLVPWNR